MILSINLPEDMRKFAEKADPTRYNLYYVQLDESYWLRPSKTSRNLDTVKYTGEKNEKLVQFLKQRYGVINLQEITFVKD